MKNIPWVEKYRPNDFNDIVLDKYNKDILENIVKKNYFPNLLFYGPPGTGKTTTIISLIKKYQQKYGENYKELIIHLNASDERGIETIRNQIHSFVNSKNLFGKGKKFVILDEIDHMTTNAQEALKSLMNNTTIDVCFCLICNYISKIDVALQNILLKLRFNQLPKGQIVKFLNNIVKKESLQIKKENIEMIQKTYNSDLRSMINYLQLNHDNLKLKNNTKITHNEIYETLKEKKDIQYFIEKYAKVNELETKEFIKQIFSFILEKKLKEIENIEFLFQNASFIVHNLNINERFLLKHTSSVLKKINYK